MLIPVVVLYGSYGRLTNGTTEPDPIGDASDRGWDKDNCFTSELLSRSNGTGVVAAVRDSVCDLGFGIDTKAYYVFVRKIGERNNRSNLVLRLVASIERTPPPTVEWATPSRVRIGFAGAVSPVTKEISQLNGIAIELWSAQPYAAIVEGSPSLQINPNQDALALMAFDLLPLPARAPTRPFTPTGEYSVFGCERDLLSIAKPTLDALERLRDRLEGVRRVTGSYPAALHQVVIQGVAFSDEKGRERLRPSDIVPGLQIIYHRFGDSYALELRFPDLRPNYVPPTEDLDSEPSEAFVNCTTIHFGISKLAVVKTGGWTTNALRDGPPILFTPRLGVYMYTPNDNNNNG